ncbi:MAG TPA: TAXI family TRAP transporter solute-binding subunit [Burkholderiaceae bacterium]|nr:TAXI family TRAP transporter solute-binding subunit [Burkholderiaceae bacterium]
MSRWVPMLLATLLPALQAQAATEYKIVTASERGTYIQIGRDLAKFVAPAADIALEVLPSAGSAENVHRLRYEPGVKFALVQSDVYQAFINQGAAGNAEAAAIIKPLRLIMPLYNEEIYFIARSDSPMNYVHEIRDAKINVGPLQSGTAMSATTIYRLMFNQPIPEEATSFLSNEDALVKLVSDKTVDVVIAVAGQPAKLLTDMKPEAKSLIKLLKIDTNHPATKAALKTYFASSVRVDSYPNLLTEDVPGFAVKAFLVTYDYSLPSTLANLSRFARSLCENFATLQTQGHPKWKEVDLAMPEVGKGWIYSPPTAKEFKRCAAQVKPARKACTTEQKILGLCE